MTVLAEDLIALITGSTTVTSQVGERVHYNRIPAVSNDPHIWLRTETDQRDRTFDGVGGLHVAEVDLECVAVTESLAQTIGDRVRNLLDGYSGTMGNVRAQGIFIDDKDDDYRPKSTGEDLGRSVVAFDLRVLFTT